MNERDEKKLQNAYDLGHSDGLRAAEPLPEIPGGWSGTVRWREEATRIDGYLRYEREALRALHNTLYRRSVEAREVERGEERVRAARAELDAARADPWRSRARRVWWLLRAPERRELRRVEARLYDQREDLALTDRCVQAITVALERCRDALDRELAGAACAAEEAAGLRRESSRPSWVIEYEIGAFLSEDPRRGLPAWHDGHGWDAGGADYGHEWTLEDPACPWERTSWRISWLNHGDPAEERTDEIYAYELDPHGRPRRVWLLGRLYRDSWLDDPLNDALWSLPRPVARGRNSLLAAAEAIHTLITREKAHEPAPA